MLSLPMPLSLTNPNGENNNNKNPNTGYESSTLSIPLSPYQMLYQTEHLFSQFSVADWCRIQNQTQECHRVPDNNFNSSSTLAACSPPNAASSSAFHGLCCRDDTCCSSHPNQKTTSNIPLSICDVSENLLTRENLNIYQQHLVHARNNKHGNANALGQIVDCQNQKLLKAVLCFGIPLSESVMDILVRKYDAMIPMERFILEPFTLGQGRFDKAALFDHASSEHCQLQRKVKGESKKEQKERSHEEPNHDKWRRMCFRPWTSRFCHSFLFFLFLLLISSS